MHSHLFARVEADTGINLVTVLVVLETVMWLVLIGPLQSHIGGTTTINVNAPAQATAKL